jgi:hypothetical protein
MSIFKKLTKEYRQTEAIKKAVKQMVEQQRRSQILQPQQENHGIVDPAINGWTYDLLYNWAIYSPVLRPIHESIIKECTRNRGAVKPKWMRKCPKCGSEFQTKKEQCPDCKLETIKPDINQKKILEAFLEDPNVDDELLDIQVSSFRYMLSLSDWYISIQYAEGIKPLTVYVEDATKMRVCSNKQNGTLGNGEMFCPDCTAKYPEETVPKGKPCPHCHGLDQKETAYIYLDGTVKARFAKDEILHGKLDANLPSLYGLSREISILKILSTLGAMDDFNFDNYSEGKLAQILVFEGLPQSDANNLAQDVFKQRNMAKYDANTGRYVVNKLRTLFFGSPKTVTNVPTMPESEKMQSLDWWKLWRETACAVYQVQDVLAGAQQQGVTGQNPRMKVDVNNNTTEAYQHAWADPFNNVIVPKLGVTDWIYEFNPVEEKDEAQDTAILQAKLNAIQTAINLGFEAELTDEQEVKISGKPLSNEEKFKRQQEMMQKQLENKPKEDSNFQGKQPFKKENVFASEKGIKNQYIVTELKNNNE